MKRRVLGAVGVILAGLTCAGCPQWVTFCDLPGNPCGDAGPTDGGGDVAVIEGGGDATPDAPGCDLGKEPKDAPLCVSDAVGVFVSAMGDDMNPGTKASPVKTLGKALTIVGSKPRVYVCEGTYAESVDLTKPVSIYGGFKCADWSYSGAKPTVASSKPLHVANVSGATLADLAFTANDAQANGESSIAAFVDSSTLTFLRCALSAGVAKDGTNGATGSNYTAVAQSDVSIKGNNASGITGGAPHVCSLCTDSKNSVGGAGGSGGGAPVDGQDGQPNLMGMAPNDGKGGTKDTGSGCANGHKGATGDAGAPAPAPATSGTLDASGWKPASGTAGTNGGPAQGAGGGGGGIDGTNMSGGGGGGGCGGCGGAAGTGGSGGGASLALVSLSSTLTLTACSLTTKASGKGGTGAAGQSGQLGGFGGLQAAPGCPGGQGGQGGLGGGGAGGAGGLSVAILYKGTKPASDAMTLGSVMLGAKGTGGTGGASNNGPDGVAQAELQAP